jgi:hypothetical protein
MKFINFFLKKTILFIILFLKKGKNAQSIPVIGLINKSFPMVSKWI